MLHSMTVMSMLSAIILSATILVNVLWDLWVMESIAKVDIITYVLLLYEFVMMTLICLTAEDIDECTEQPNIVMCDENANCTNVIGSYDCVCNPGYNGTGFICAGKIYDESSNILCASLTIYLPDIDECSTNLRSCDDPQRAICTNNIGSFACQCKPGYTGSGFKNDCGMYVLSCIDMSY